MKKTKSKKDKGKGPKSDDGVIPSIYVDEEMPISKTLLMKIEKASLVVDYELPGINSARPKQKAILNLNLDGQTSKEIKEILSLFIGGVI